MKFKEEKIKQKQKREKKRTEHLQTMGQFGNVKHMHNWNKRKRDNGAEVFEVIITKNFPKLMNRYQKNSSRKLKEDRQ